MTSEVTSAVYWPRGVRTVTVQPLPPRPATLEGKTIAFLWDFIFRGDEIFPIIKRELNKRYANMKFIGSDEFGSTHGDDEHAILASLPERLKALKVDGVISGMGC